MQNMKSSDRLLRQAEVSHITGLSRTTIWRLERKGKFPSRRQISLNSVGWLSSELEAWVVGRQQVGDEAASP